MSVNLPEATVRPCNECPWVKASTPGWLGPHDSDTWINLAHSDEAIACHKTIVEDGEWVGNTKQCMGAAQYRRNVAKRPRDPQVAVAAVPDAAVFGNPTEFKNHHDRSN